jgi:regulatory protein
MPDITAGTITAIERQKKRPDRVNVHLDGAFGFALAEEVAVAAGLRRGQRLDAAEVAALRDRESDRQAYESALNFLSFRPRSAVEVERSLAEKGHDAARVAAVLDRLRGAGLVDDAAFARYWIANRDAFSPRGERALRAELRQKGVADEVVAAVLEEQVTGDESSGDAARAVEAGRKKARQLRGLDRSVFRQRLSGFLARRGFGYDEVREAVDALWTASEPSTESDADSA